MTVEIRMATVADAQEIAHLIDIVWGDKPSITTVEYVLRNDNHSTYVAEIDNGLLGFVDGFLSIAKDGTLRWELDLVAVHPDFRGQGLAKRLIEKNTTLGFSEGVDLARGLVRVDNFPVHRVFNYCGYRLQDAKQQLYVHSESTDKLDLQNIHQGYLLSVATLNYVGIWIEGEISEQSIQSGILAQNLYGWDVIGVVFPIQDEVTRKLLIENNFALIGDYYWCEKINK